MNFNKQQLKAIQFKDGACAVIAGAGSGKSTVLTERTRYLIEEYGVDPNDILIISFTKPARFNMIDKLNNIGICDVNVHTFHSLCLNILIQESYPCDLIDMKKDKYKIVKILREYNKKLKNSEIDNIFDFILYQKRYGLTYTDEFVDCEIMVSENDMRKYFIMYEKYKEEYNLTDFEDWINSSINILQNNSEYHTYKYIMVDEHQDSNLIQNKLIKLLCPNENIFCVFDYRQAIYGFTGASPTYCMNFAKDYKNAKVINLDINYRSCENIVINANNFIRQYYGDYEYYSDSVGNNKNNGRIEKITTYSRYEEAEEILNRIQNLIKQGEDLNNIGVLYRLNSHADHLVQQLKDNNIPFDIKSEGTFFKRKEIDLIISVLRLIENTNDDEAFEKLNSYRAKGLNFFRKKDLEKLKNHSGKYNLNLFQSLSLIKFKEQWQRRNVNNFIDNIEKLRIQKDKNIKLSKIIDNIYKLFDMNIYIESNWKTLEQQDRKDSLQTLKEFAKGNNIKSFLKFANGENISKKKNKDGVKLMTIHGSKGLEFKHVFVIGIEDSKFPHNKSDLIEEARLFYVAITRPKENLYLSQIYDGNLFIDEYFKNKEVIQPCF